MHDPDWTRTLSNGRRYPLEVLREGVRIDAERKVIRDAWIELERVMGFKPVTRVGRNGHPRNDPGPNDGLF